MPCAFHSQQVLPFVVQKGFSNGESFSATACAVPRSFDWQSKEAFSTIIHTEQRTKLCWWLPPTQLKEVFGLNVGRKMRNVVNTVKYNANRDAEWRNKTMTVSLKELGEIIFFSFFWLFTGVSVMFHTPFLDSLPLALNSWLAYFFSC